LLRIKASSFTPGIEISDVGIDIATVEMRDAETIDVQIQGHDGVEMVRLEKKEMKLHPNKNTTTF
jgi:hypothetical protein